MIYGINFNGSHIPLGVSRKFPQRIRLTECKHLAWSEGGRRKVQIEFCDTCHLLATPGEHVELKGVGQSTDERDAMLVQANNGHHTLFVLPRQTPVGTWYGIYS
jgi:hypothetical protein